MGKVVQLLSHPDELKAAVQLKFFRKHLHQRNEVDSADTLIHSYELLKLTSRSFAAVIEELHPELKDVVMIFYLVLRALDTVEDDMTIASEIKVPILRDFHKKLDLKSWSFDGNGPNEKDRAVLTDFNDILTEYHKLKPQYREIIQDITNKMGNGMADYILDEDFNLSGVATVKDYDLYCHYVAGLVGEGLTKLMVLAKFADDGLMEDGFAKTELMGLFLQKTNIIRDYHEDLLDGRSFWPKEIWSKYTQELPSFHKDTSIDSEEQALSCINELVLNALNHVKDVLTYLSMVKDPSCFNFCAIPQVMAIATLATIYNNRDILHGNVKIRKGTTCKLILQSRTLPGVVKIFKEYIQIINHKSNVKDNNYLKIGIKCGEIEQFIETMYPSEDAIPEGANRKLEQVNTYIEERASIDQEISLVVAEETFQCNLTLGSLLVVIFGVLFYLTK